MTSRLRTIALVSVVCLLATTSVASGQDWTGRGRVQGRVEDKDGNPLEGVKVTLHQPGRLDTGPGPLVTNKKGRFGYLGLAGGPWTVIVELDGYITAEGTDTVNPFGAGKEWVFTLREIPPEQLYEEKAGLALQKLETGNVLLEQGQFAEARSAYEQAMPDLELEYHPPILLGIARSYYQEENIEMSLETLEKALTLSPDYVDGLKLISNILIAEGRESEAQAYMDRLPETEALDANAYLNVGIDHYNAGSMDEALVQFERVVSGFPDNAEGYYYRGLVRLAKQLNEDAKADLEKYLELAPEGSHAEEAKQFMAYLVE